MARLAPARKAALAAVSERRRRSGRIRELLRSSDAMAALDARDRALASRIAFGAVAAEGMLDELLNTYIKRPSSVEPRVRDALRVAAFECCYLDTPERAAVSQGVELVRSVSKRAAGMANAVLRRLAEDVRPRVEEARARCRGGGADLSDLQLVSGLPAWIVERVLTDRGAGAARDMALSQLEAAPVYVASNLARHDADETRRLLEAHGLMPVATQLPAGFQLGAPAGLATSGLVEAVDVVVSDLAAQSVTRRVAPQRGQHVLEIGQGRGTKTILIQNECLLKGGMAHITGIDSEVYKVRVSEERMKEAGLSDWVRCLEFDATQLSAQELPQELDKAFDLVFIDVPCSGTGTMRRHPEIAWQLEEDSLQGDGSLPDLQIKILRAASSRVAVGGRLAYATCSIVAAENERQVEAFLNSVEGEGFSLEGEYFQSIPAPSSCDGHFCAVMRRL